MGCRVMHAVIRFALSEQRKPHFVPRASGLLSGVAVIAPAMRCTVSEFLFVCPGEALMVSGNAGRLIRTGAVLCRARKGRAFISSPELP